MRPHALLWGIARILPKTHYLDQEDFMASSRMSLAGGLLLFFVVLASVQDASAFPAFARK